MIRPRRDPAQTRLRVGETPWGLTLPGAKPWAGSGRAAGNTPWWPGTAAAMLRGMNSIHRRTLLVLLTAALLAWVTAGCQTSKGFGQDVEKLGDKIQEKAS